MQCYFSAPRLLFQILMHTLGKLNTPSALAKQDPLSLEEIQGKTEATGLPTTQIPAAEQQLTKFQQAFPYQEREQQPCLPGGAVYRHI